MWVLVEELSTLHQLHGRLVVLLLQELDDLLLQRVDLQLMDEYLLFLVFERQPQLGDSCPIFKVLLLLLEEVGTWTISLLLLSSSIGASTNISSVQSG